MYTLPKIIVKISPQNGTEQPYWLMDYMVVTNQNCRERPYKIWFQNKNLLFTVCVQ